VAEHAIQVTIGAKDEATKAIKAIDKELAALTKKKATIAVDLSTEDAARQLADIDESISNLRSQKAAITVEANVKQALDALDDVVSESKKAEKAAQALGDAIGPELSREADLDSIVADFKRMGLSLDDITANADRLGSKLREVGSTVGLDQVGQRAGVAADNTRKLTDSARGANSALANMVGNSAQDLGQVAGVAGSAGVAVGQMAEYFADATLGAESFRSALTSMVAVAGPIAALAAVVEIISSAVQAFSDRNKTAADNTEMLTEAMREGGDAAENYADALASSGKVLADVGDNKGYRDIQKGLFGMLTQCGAVPFVVGQAGELLGLFGKKTEDVTKNLLDAGFTADTWAQAVAGGADAVAKTAAAMDANNISADEQDKILTALKGSQNDYTRATERAAIMNGFFGTEVDDAAEKLKASQKAYKETGDALEEWADRTTKAVEDASQAFIDLADAQTTLDDMGGVFEQMKLNSDALSLAFDLGNAPLEALERVTDVNDAIRDLGDFIKKEGKPNIFDPNDIDAGPFLAKIDSLRGPIQSAITDAFATGGPTAATATADAYVKQIVSSLHGKLTAGEVRTLLGLDDLQATLKIAVDEASKNEAVKILEVLTGLTGESPWTANIQLALDAGTLSADAAKILESEQLRKLGIDVPATLLDIPAKDKAAAKAEADRWAADPQHAVDLQSVLASPSVKALTDARNKGQADADLIPPISFRTTVKAPTFNDAGGTIGDGGGIVGERRPEIINGRYLVTGPSWVPPGTRVTSGARTARILRTRGTRGLRRYDSGGIVGGPTTLNVTLNTAVVGNRYDTMRAVAKATKDGLRLRGTRG
jgi:hypothetical protein